MKNRREKAACLPATFAAPGSAQLEDEGLSRFGGADVVGVAELAVAIEGVGPSAGGRFRSKARHQITSNLQGSDRETDCVKRLRLIFS